MKRAILTALDRFFDFILYGFDSEPGRAQDYHYLRSDESWLKTSAQKPTGGSGGNDTEVRESSVTHG
jgi:hypothetical protein